MGGEGEGEGDGLARRHGMCPHMLRIGGLQRDITHGNVNCVLENMCSMPCSYGTCNKHSVCGYNLGQYL